MLCITGLDTPHALQPCSLYPQSAVEAGEAAVQSPPRAPHPNPALSSGPYSRDLSTLWPRSPLVMD